MEDNLKSVFIKPDNENIKIWRFLDFPKFASMLDKHSLFFSNAVKMDDAFEGELPKSNLDWIKTMFEKAGTPLEQISKQIKLSIDNFDVKNMYLLNCWHMNDDESDLMWKKYVSNGFGVAIQSTFKKIESAFSDNSKVWMGIVRYIDYQKDSIPIGNGFHQFLHKRKNFSDERELRLITYYDITSFTTPSKDALNSIIGKHVEVKLDDLIEKIYVSPNSPDWFSELVSSVSKKFGIDKPIIKSSISTSPDY